MSHPVVLTLSEFYLPGFKAGGPIQSVSNLVSQLGSEFSFNIATGDRDLGDYTSYCGINLNCWQQHDFGKIKYYSNRLNLFYDYVLKFRYSNFDILYINSVMNFKFSITPLVIKYIGIAFDRPVIIAPRGELSHAALKQKALKKKIFIAISRALGLHRKVIWHASSEYEANDIRRQFGPKANIHIASNLPRAPQPARTRAQREPGAPLRLIFVGRISPIKNLDFALNVLDKFDLPVHFTIIGPTEDIRYTNKCLALAEQLPDNIDVSWLGALPPDAIGEIMANNDLFFLPSRGENFGHIISEALAVGTPVLLSNKTPWRNLAKFNVGHDLPLDKPELFLNALRSAWHQNRDSASEQRMRVLSYSKQFLQNTDNIEANRQLFRLALMASKNCK
jgi:glycosyltransferase involved in cell wall biosynthesis